MIIEETLYFCSIIVKGNGFYGSVSNCKTVNLIPCKIFMRYGS